jgi:hypothetical protein
MDRRMAHHLTQNLNLRIGVIHKNGGDGENGPFDAIKS